MKLIELLKNVSVWDVDEDEELMNTSELDPSVFEMLCKYVIMDGFLEKADLEKEIPEETIKECFKQESSDCLEIDYSGLYQELVLWAYFLSKGYEPDPEADYFGFPELYVDYKDYQIIFNTIGYQKDYYIDIDTL